MSRARDIANAITVPEFSGNVEIIGTSPELTFETTNSSHYNFQISVQENVSGGLEISSGSADADSSNDTFTPRLVVLNDGKIGIGTISPSTGLSVVTGSANGIELGQDSDASTDSARLFFSTSGGSNAIHSSSGAMRFFTGSTAGSSSGSERMRIDSSGNVGIGTTSPLSATNFTALTVQNNTYGGIVQVKDDTVDLRLQIQADTSGRVGTHSNHPLRFDVNSTERMRIDSSGNLLVGTTDTSLYNNSGSGEGLSYFPSQFLTVATYQQETAIFNRLSNDGTIVQFRKDGATVGSIGVGGSSAQPVIGSNNATAGGTAAGLRFDRANNSIQPWNVVSNASADDTIDLGYSSIRFDDIYATNGTIQTSDENEKQDIASITTAELAVGKRLSTLFKTFRWKSKVTEKADKARTHSGIIAQEVKAAFEAEGLDATKYALFCSDTWTNDDGDEQTRMGVRYPELLSFIASYNESRFTAIEARLAKLEG